MTASEFNPLREKFGGIQRTALAIGVVFFLLTFVQLFLKPAAFFQSYLFAFLFWNGLTVGSLGIILMHNVVGGIWGVMIRRMTEAAARLLPIMAILLLPVIIGMVGWHELYKWSDPAVAHGDPNVALKTGWLNIPFWLARTVFYFLVWWFLGTRISRWTAEQDNGDFAGIQSRMKSFSAPSLLLFVLTVTFAYVDWIMSLEPEWFSTIYGAMFMIAQVLETLGFAVALLYLVSPWRPFRDVLKAQHYWDLGTLIFAFTMLWAYLSFSQFLIIWSGNLPDEIPWYLRRFSGGWGFIAVFMALFHFGLPFFLLLIRFIKKNPRLLYIVALWVFAVRVLDIYWIVVPALRTRGYYFEWSDIVAPIGIGGIWIAAFLWQFGKRPMLPLNDPRVYAHGRPMVAE